MCQPVGHILLMLVNVTRFGERITIAHLPPARRNTRPYLDLNTQSWLEDTDLDIYIWVVFIGTHKKKKTTYFWQNKNVFSAIVNVATGRYDLIDSGNEFHRSGATKTKGAHRNMSLSCSSAQQVICYQSTEKNMPLGGWLACQLPGSNQR